MVAFDVLAYLYCLLNAYLIKRAASKALLEVFSQLQVFHFANDFENMHQYNCVTAASVFIELRTDL